jgi:hypothetical protein
VELMGGLPGVMGGRIRLEEMSGESGRGGSCQGAGGGAACLGWTKWLF